MKNLTNNKISKLLKEEVKASRDAVSTNWKETTKGNINLESFTFWLISEVEYLQKVITFSSNKLKKSRRKDFKEIMDLTVEALAQISISNILNPNYGRNLDSYNYRELSKDLIRTVQYLLMEIYRCARKNAYRK